MIELNKLIKEFRKPIRKKGVLGMLTTLFSRKYELIRAVDELSFTINDGESVGYIGANGAGKSTTIKMMSGILTPSGGECRIDGLRPYISKERNKVLKNIGVVFGQRTQLWWDLPLSESFTLLKEIYEVSQSDFEQRFDFIKNVLDLKKFLSSPVRTLSLGQRMRADIGAALIHNPKILFLDEPTIGLDVLVKKKVKEAIKQIQAKYNTTLILTTHDMDDIEDLCQRVIIIDEGKLLYDGALDKIKSKFGDIRNIEVDYSGEVDIQRLNECFKTGLINIEILDGKLVLAIDATLLHINAALETIFKNVSINDIKIKETSIEQVIQKIYESKEV